MPEGSLGREYFEFMNRARITSDGLVAAPDSRVDPNANVELDDARAYVSDRLRDTHDLWHVLTDYGADDAGEIANLWFSVGQFGNPGMAFIAFFGNDRRSLRRRLRLARVLLSSVRPRLPGRAPRLGAHRGDAPAPD